MAISKIISTEGTTRAYEITFRSKSEPMTLRYTNTIEGFKGKAEVDKEMALEVISEEDLANLQIILQKLADGFNPDREV